VTPISLGIFASANQSAPGTSFESIATVTVGSGGAASAEFTSIPSTYTHLQIRCSYLHSATQNPYLRVGGSSIDSGSNYSWHHLWGDGSSAQSNGASSTTFTYFGYSQNTSNANLAIIDILDYANANKNKTFRILAGQDNNGGGEVALWSGAWRDSATAIQKITLYAVTGTFNQYSHFALYGCKSA
jgi:hypothetical protein